MAEMEITAPAEQPRSSPSSSSRLAVLSIALSLIGVGLIPVLTFPLGSKYFTLFSPPWRPVLFVGFSGIVFTAAITLAILSRTVAGHSVYHALRCAILGTAIWLLMLLGALAINPTGEPVYPTSLYSQELVNSPATFTDPLPYSTEVTLRALGTRRPVMIVTAEEPRIVTEEAINAGAPVPNKDWVAVPLTIEVVDAAAVTSGATLPNRLWRTPSQFGGFLDRTSAGLRIPGYPTVDSLDLTREGTYHVYDFFDTSTFESGEGAYMLLLLGPSTSGAYWR